MFLEDENDRAYSLSILGSLERRVQADCSLALVLRDGQCAFDPGAP